MKKKIPAWAIVISIFLLLFGGCSIKSSVQLIVTPTVLDVQQEAIHSISEAQRQQFGDSLMAELGDSIKNPALAAIPFLGKSMEEMFSMSEETQQWMVRFGYMGFFVTVLYFLAGIFLLVIHKYSLKIVYASLGICILFGIVKAIVITGSGSSFLSIITGMSGIFGIVLDIVLLILILVFDKSAYRFEEQIPGK